MLRVVTLLCLVGVALSGGGALKKYASMKIQESCFGAEYMNEWKMKMKGACDVCQEKPLEQTIVDIRNMVQEMKKNSSPFFLTRQSNQQQQPLYVPIPVYVNQNLEQNRNKRSAEDWDLSPEGLDKMHLGMLMKMSNMTCVMKELNFMTEDNHPNYAFAEEEIEKLTVDASLKEDLSHAMGMCKDFSMCMPFDKATNPIKKHFGKMMAYVKCCEKKKIQVCMKHDMKTYAPMMGYEGDVESEEADALFDLMTNMVMMEA